MQGNKTLAYEVHALKTHAHEMHAYEMHAYKMHAYKVHAHKMHTYEMHAHETHTREVCAHENFFAVSETLLPLFSGEIKRQERYRTLGYDHYQLGVRCIKVATRIEGGDRGQVQWTCGLDSLNRGAATQGPKTGGLAKELRHVKRLLRCARDSSRLAQDCTATAQGCLLTPQVKTASP